MSRFMKIYELAREYDLSTFEVQECARKLGLPHSKAVTMLNAEQVDLLRPALEAEQRMKHWQRSRRGQATNAKGDVVRVECACCQLTLDCRADHGPSLCGACRDHFAIPGESVERKVARLGDHDVRMRKAYLAAREAYHESRRKVASALASRDTWREAATKLVQDHIAGLRGHCNKCNQLFPCEPVRVLQSVNYGYWKFVDGLAGFSEEETERHTNPRKAAEREVWRDEGEA